MTKIRGIEITEDWTQAKTGQITAHMRVKRWYMPFFIAKWLHRYGLPLRYWPLMYWRYYIIRGEYRPRCVNVSIKSLRRR